MTDSRIPHLWQHDGPDYWSTDYIAAPRSKVFEHLTRGEFTQLYYFGMPINNPSAVGDPVYYGPSEEKAPIRGHVTIFDVPERFGHTFSFPHHDEPATTVEFTLTDVGADMTRLDTFHYGFTDRDSSTFNDICSGWPAILSSLKTLLETGEPLSWPEPEDGPQD